MDATAPFTEETSLTQEAPEETGDAVGVGPFRWWHLTSAQTDIRWGLAKRESFPVCGKTLFARWQSRFGVEDKAQIEGPLYNRSTEPITPPALDARRPALDQERFESDAFEPEHPQLAANQVAAA
jgi:hypothetical protein